MRVANSDLRTYFVVGDQPTAKGDGHLMAGGSVKALTTLWPMVTSLLEPKGKEPPVTTMSRMSPYMLAENNLIYVGTYSQMGLIRDVLVEHSNFRVNDADNTVFDKATSRRFPLVPRDADISATRSYGYIACFDRPSGNRIIVLSGFSDGALAQVASIAAKPEVVDQIARKGGRNFEALFLVTALNGVNVGYQLAAIHPLGRGVVQ